MVAVEVESLDEAERGLDVAGFGDGPQPRLSSTTEEPVRRASSPYRAAICGQSCGSSTCRAASAACSTWVPRPPRASARSSPARPSAIWYRVNAGEQYWPSRAEEKELVFPEQEPFKRRDEWENYLDEYVNAEHGTLATDIPRRERDFFASTELYDKALNIKADRIDGNGQMDTRISNAMKSLGFIRHRQTTGKRQRGFLRRPVEETNQMPAAPEGGQQAEEEGHDLPF